MKRDLNEFTSIIHSKGWKVEDAVKFWGITYDTYNRRCNNPKFRNQLICMCRGLNEKNMQKL